MNYRLLSESTTIKDLQRPIFNERALRNWYARAAYADRTPITVMSLSDSILEGHNMLASSGTPATSELPMHRVGRRLQDRYAGGPARQAIYHPLTLSLGPAFQPADWPVSLSGGDMTLGNTFGLGSRSYTFSGTDTVTVEFSSANDDAEFRFYFTRYLGGGNFRWTLNGGATGTVSTDGGLQDMHHAAIAVPTSGTHSIEITVESGTLFASGFMILEAADKASGVRVFESGHASVSSEFMATSAYLDDWVSAAAPDLAIIELGANDFSSATPRSKEDFANSMVTIIDRIQAGSPDCSILICSVWKLGPASPPVDEWDGFRSQMKTVAASKSAAFLDLSPSIRGDEEPTNTNAGGMLTDNAHLSVAGADRIASKIVAVL